MNQKTICKIVIDVLMTILMLGLMAYLLIGEAAHEWMGIAIFVLFIAHHGLNLHWHKNLFKGRYTPLRILQTVLDVLLLVFMVGSMISGIMMSQVFSFLQITHGMAYARIVHMLTSYWGFALTGMHAGLHWSMVMGMMKKAMHIKKTSHVRTDRPFKLQASKFNYRLGELCYDDAEMVRAIFESRTKDTRMYRRGSYRWPPIRSPPRETSSRPPPAGSAWTCAS